MEQIVFVNEHGTINAYKYMWKWLLVLLIYVLGIPKI